MTNRLKIGAKPLIGLAVFAVFVAGVSAVWFLSSDSGTETRGIPNAWRKGDQVPELTLHPIEGKSTKLTQLKGKVILINFWASWCESCIIEMPSLVRLWKAHSEKGLLFIGMNVDANPNTAVPKTFRRLNLSFPVFVDKNQELSRLFRVYGIPFTVILDSNLKILHIEMGERDWDTKEIHQQIQAWLSS